METFLNKIMYRAQRLNVRCFKVVIIKSHKILFSVGGYLGPTVKLCNFSSSDIQRSSSKWIIYIEKLLKPFVNIEAFKKIDKLPFSINEPGYYILSKNLVSNFDVAITIRANNVTLNFDKYQILMNKVGKLDPYKQIYGIDIKKCVNVNLVNVKIIHSSYKLNHSIGVRVDSCRYIAMNNCSLIRTTYGITITNSSFVDFLQCVYVDNYGTRIDNVPRLLTLSAGILLEDKTSHVTIDFCKFRGGSEINGMFGFCISSFFDSIVHGVVIRGCKFNNVYSSVHLYNVINLTIEDLKIYQKHAEHNAIQIGFGDDSFKNILIKDVEIIAQSSKPGYDGIILMGGCDIILDNIMLDVHTVIDEDYIPAALHLGFKNTPVTNCILKNISIKGTNYYGLFVEEADGVLLKKSKIGNAKINVNIEGSKNVIIRKNYIRCGKLSNGINLENSSACQIYLNHIVDAEYPIYFGCNTFDNFARNNKIGDSQNIDTTDQNEIVP